MTLNNNKNNKSIMSTIIPDTVRKELQFAKNLLENPGMAAKITNYFGVPIEKGLEVFALGGNSKSDNGTESGYYVVRALLAKSITELLNLLFQRQSPKKAHPF